jgi:hypothetical protein
VNRGEQLPLFRVIDVDGREHAYADLWQRTAILLLLVRDDDPHRYHQQVAARRSEIQSYDAAVIVARGPIAGISEPAALIADRWGEVQFSTSSTDGTMPTLDELIDWLKYVQQRCPECEGEAR